MTLKKVLVIFGTRPEAIKMAPVVLRLKEAAAFQTKVAVTAQHRQMLDQVLDIFAIQPDFDLISCRLTRTCLTSPAGLCSA